MTSDSDRTRTLFAPLIKRPPLTDQLLQRPPFKFLHDVVVETVKSTGFLHGVFSADELDTVKAGGSRDSKVAFLQKLIDVLNVDGALDGVKPAKIVAGKESELTNLMLQRLAEEAAASMPATSKSGGEGQGRERKRVAPKAVKTKEKGLGGVGKAKSKLPSKTRTPSKERDKTAKVKGEGEERKKRSASKSRSKENGLASSKETSPSKSKSASTTATKKKKAIEPEPPEPAEEAQLEKKHSLTTTDEGISSPQNNRDRVLPPPQPLSPSARPESRTPPRESSGATSKGGDDSGIAEGVESGRHSAMEEGHVNAVPPSSASIQPPEVLTLTRPMTATAARPQTAMGRPGTAMARPAPPRQLKKSKVGDLDPSTVGAQLPSTVDSATLMLEEAGGISDDGSGEPLKKAIVDSSEQFLVEVEDEEEVEAGLALAAIASTGDGANVASLASGDGHGSLVNKIIENARELEKSDLAAVGLDASAGASGAGADLTELKRSRLEIELIQRALQKTTQGVQPLTRTLEFIADDFDTTLREIDECRKARVACEKALQDRGTSADNAPKEKLFTLSAKLRNLDGEVRDVKEQIAAARASVIEHERKILDALLPR